MLFAADVLERNPGAVIIYDVKCTGRLPGQILRHGGSPLMWKTGHSLIKAKMRETDAELAGEMSGHFFFKERWYGFDDGIYAAARLLEILAAAAAHAERSARRAAQRRVDAGDQGRTRRTATRIRFVDRFRDEGAVRRRAPVDHRRPARRLAGWLGPGACVQHHAGAGDALRRRQRGSAGAHQGRLPRASCWR